MAFHKIAYAVWKHPANACDCGAAPPAPTAPAQGEVDHARATRLSDTMLRDDGYVPSLNERQNLARSHAALLREVEAHKKRYKDACKTCGDLEDQLEAAEAKVAALRFELAEYVRADACHQESIAGSEQRAEAAERQRDELREALQQIAWLRPLGDTKNHLLIKMEKIALAALAAAPAQPQWADPNEPGTSIECVQPQGDQP